MQWYILLRLTQCGRSRPGRQRDRCDPRHGNRVGKLCGLDFYAEVNINVVEAATPESAALATPETAAQAAPETATPESAAPATRKQLQHPKARFLSPRSCCPVRPRKQPRRRVLNPQRLKLLLLQRPLLPETANPRKCSSGNTGKRRHTRNSKNGHAGNCGPAQNAKSNRSPSCNSGRNNGC